MNYLSKQQFIQAVALAEQDFESEVFGGTLRLRELTQQSWRMAQLWARSKEDKDTVEADKWNTAIAAASLVDPYSPPEARAALFGVDELWELAHHGSWYIEEIYKIAQAAIDLSEVGPAHLKSRSDGNDA